MKNAANRAAAVSPNNSFASKKTSKIDTRPKNTAGALIPAMPSPNILEDI